MAYEETEKSTVANPPELVRKLIEQGHTLADAQIKELLTNVESTENLYALRYVLEHERKSVSAEILVAAIQSLYPQKTDVVFSEAPIKVEWQLRTVMIILEQMCERKFQFTSQLLDDTRNAISTYKIMNREIVQQEGKSETDDNASSFKCNYDNKFLLKVVKNTLNSISSDTDYQQTGVDQAIAVLKTLLVSAAGVRMASVEVSLNNFDLEGAWKGLVEAFQVESSGKPWYTTWRRLIKLRQTLDEWSQEKDRGISPVFKERLYLEFLWFHLGLCYSVKAAENQEVGDALWFGILDLVQQLIQDTFSVTTQAICYYLALDSLNNAASEFIQFKSIEVLLRLEAKNKELFFTTLDAIVSCDEEHVSKLMEIYHYLKEKLKIESKLFLNYSPDATEVSDQDKEESDDKISINYIADDFRCPITCETVDGLYQLNCPHLLSPEIFLSLEKQECPYCKTEIKKDNIYYLPQQTICSNIQYYVREDNQGPTAESNTSKKGMCDSRIILNTIHKAVTTPNVKKLLKYLLPFSRQGFHIIMIDDIPYIVAFRTILSHPFVFDGHW